MRSCCELVDHLAVDTILDELAHAFAYIPGKAVICNWIHASGCFRFLVSDVT